MRCWIGADSYLLLDTGQWKQPSAYERRTYPADPNLDCTQRSHTLRRHWLLHVPTFMNMLLQERTVTSSVHLMARILNTL